MTGNELGMKINRKEQEGRINEREKAKGQI